MNYDVRYDGPDVEADLSTRQQGVVMTAAMVGEALLSARASRGAAQQAQEAQAQTETLAENQQVWREGPTSAEGIAGLDDATIARRWIACAAHPREAEANEIRDRLEAELERRDPETMRDYRSWRNAGAQPPGEAMRRALAERETRLAQSWTALGEPGAEAMSSDELLRRWADAYTAHGTPRTAADLEQARAAGTRRLTELDPQRAAAWQALQAPQATAAPGAGQPGLSAAEAANRTAGRTGAFLPGGSADGATWARVARKGVEAASTAALAVANPASAGVSVVQGAVKRLAAQSKRL